MSQRSDDPVNDRREAVLSLARREEPAAVIARRKCTSEPTLYRWRDEFLAVGEVALSAGTPNAFDPRDRRIAELERRQQVIGELTFALRVSRETPGPSL
jgi:hypothetical protein